MVSIYFLYTTILVKAQLDGKFNPHAIEHSLTNCCMAQGREEKKFIHEAAK